MQNITIREALPGEPSLVAYFYFRLFEKQFDFLPITEQYFLHAAAEVYDNPEGNRIWVAVDDIFVNLHFICMQNSDLENIQLSKKERTYGFESYFYSSDWFCWNGVVFCVFSMQE